MKYGRQIAGMADFIIDVYKQNTVAVSPHRYSIFERFVKYCELIFKVGLALYILSISLYFIDPMYKYLFENQIVTLLPVYLPKIDEKSNIGYAFYLILHLLMLIFAALASAGSDFIFMMIIANVPALANIFEDSTHDLNRELLKDKDGFLMSRYKFRNILLLHKEIYE